MTNIDLNNVTFEQKKDNFHVIKVKDFNVNSSLGLLLISDLHIDSEQCQEKLLKEHLDIAKEENRLIIINGDVFDIINSFSDPRRENQYYNPKIYKKGEAYLNSVLNYAIDFLAPYVENIAIIATGNHETKIMKYNDFDIIAELVKGLNSKYNPKNLIQRSGYSGQLKIYFEKSSGGSRESKLIKFYHGTRKGGQRSKGILSSDTDSAKWPSADIVTQGDNHATYSCVLERQVTTGDKTIQKRQFHLRTGNYVGHKEDAQFGFAVENNFAYLPSGGFWVDFVNRKGQIKIEYTYKEE